MPQVHCYMEPTGIGMDHQGHFLNGRMHIEQLWSNDAEFGQRSVPSNRKPRNLSFHSRRTLSAVLAAKKLRCKTRWSHMAWLKQASNLHSFKPISVLQFVLYTFCVYKGTACGTEACTKILHQSQKPCPAGSQGTTKSFLLQAFAAVALQSLFVSGQEHCIHHHLSSVFIYVHQLSSAQPDQRCEHRSTRRRCEATLRCCSTASRYRDAAHCSSIRPTKLPRFHIHGMNVASCNSLGCLKSEIGENSKPVRQCFTSVRSFQWHHQVQALI